MGATAFFLDSRAGLLFEILCPSVSPPTAKTVWSPALACHVVFLCGFFPCLVNLSTLKCRPFTKQVSGKEIATTAFTLQAGKPMAERQAKPHAHTLHGGLRRVGAGRHCKRFQAERLEVGLPPDGGGRGVGGGGLLRLERPKEHQAACQPEASKDPTHLAPGMKGARCRRTGEGKDRGHIRSPLTGVCHLKGSSLG